MKGQNGILIPDKKLIYWYVPKCACTSLKAFFATHLKLKFSNPHSAPFKMISPRYAEDYRADGWTSFAIIRHPFDRLVSLYRDKIRSGYRGWGFKQGVEQFVFGGKKGFHEKMSFKEFALLCFQDPFYNADYHYYPQLYQLTFDKKLVPDHIFDLGEMDRVKDFLRGYGFDTDQIGHSNPTVREMNFREMYDAELLERARQYYEPDLTEFDYG